MKLFDKNLFEWKDLKNLDPIIKDIKNYEEIFRIT
jgi:hypothetical protein